MRFSFVRRNLVFQKNFLRVGVRKLLRMGLVPARLWRTSRWHRACSKAEVVEADCCSSRQERVCVVISLRGGESFGGGGQLIYHGHALLGDRCVDGQMATRAAEGVEEADHLKCRHGGERTCRSRHVRDSCPWHQMAEVAHFVV